MMNVPIERGELAELRIGFAAIQTELTAKRGSSLLRQKHGREPPVFAQSNKQLNVEELG
jgi:hypothetical protein